MEDISKNIDHVLDQMNKAAQTSGRKLEDICLVAVCKKQPIEKIAAAVKAGVFNLAENYPEQAKDKIIAIEQKNLKWHMIGHIQSRKAKLVTEYFDVVHSIDSLQTLLRLDNLLEDSEKCIDCLLEINIAGEESKSGFSVTNLNELPVLDEIISKADEMQNVRLRGLMVMPPYTDQNEKSRKYFALLKKYQHVLHQHYPHQKLDFLSMGTSQDFTIAIQEGATHIRVGTAIFGNR
jgi:PLP dependent protein